MLKVDPTLDHVPAKKEHVIALFESINQPLVNIPSYGTAPTGAFVLGTRNDQGAYTAFVYLYQVDTRAVVVYISEPRGLSTEQYRREEQEAVRFVESMGFMIDNVHFPTLAPTEQEAVMARIPMFRPPVAPSELYSAPAGPTDPFGATDQQIDAIFGGFSAQEADVFRHAGMGSTPPIPGSPTHPPPMSPPFGASTLPPAPGTVPPVPQSGPQSSPLGQPTSNGPKLDSAALERLGRLLGAFVWPVVLVLSMFGSACKSGGATAAQREEMGNQVDIGNQQLAQGQFAQAIRAFELVTEQDSEHKGALRGLGLAYLNLGRLVDAEKYYRRSVKADDTWSIPKNELAIVLIQTGRCDEAQPLLEAVLKDIFYATPEYAEHNLAKARACQGDVDDAIDRLEKLVTKRPHFCLGYLTLAQLSAQAKKHEVTISACDDFSHNCEQHEQIKKQVSPEQSDLCYLKKGLAYAEMGDLESARAAFSRCRSRGQHGKECKKSLEMLPP